MNTTKCDRAMTSAKLGGERGKLNLQLPLRFNSGTFIGNIVDAGNVTLAWNVHANIGPELVLACNSFASLSAQNETYREALQQVQRMLGSAFRLDKLDAAEAVVKAALSPSGGDGV